MVFAAFVSWIKLSPRCLALWREILARVPSAMLVFSPLDAREAPRYLRRLEAFGIGADRVVMLRPAVDDAHAPRALPLVDAVLDTLPYTGGDTTAAALDMGVPVVTRVGERHAERVTYSLLAHLGVTATVAHSDEEYVALGCRIAQDAQWRASIASAIVERLPASGLADPARHARASRRRTGALCRRARRSRPDHMHLHILGICGTFMGGIAAIARQAGHTVTGCDANVYPPMSTQLAALGIELTEGYDAAQLDGVAKHADVFVVGNAISRGNPLLEAILDAGPCLHVGTAVAGARRCCPGKWVLAVAGTHGKTTTTSMLAWILEHARLEPGFLIGGVAVDFGVSARLTDSPFFVIEADEYDTAFFDKRSKFVHYRPRTAILNNLEYDHADIFPDLAAIETQFHHLVRTVPHQGRLIVNGGEESLRRVLARGCWSEVERFGVAERDGAADTGSDWTIAVDGTIKLGGAPQGVLAAFALLGRHNQLNALAAIAAARHAGVPVAHALAALAAFRGIKRRLEMRGIVDGVTVYDDFAHHPTAIATTLDGAAPQRRRRAHSRRARAALEHDEAGHDEGAAAGEPGRGRPRLSATRRTSAGTSPARCAARRLAPKCTPISRAGRGDRARCARRRSVVVMSNGGFGGIHDKLLAALARIRTLTRAADHRLPARPQQLAAVGQGARARRGDRRAARRRAARMFECPQLHHRPALAMRDVAAMDRRRTPRSRSRSSAARSAGSTRRISPSATARAPC